MTTRHGKELGAGETITGKFESYIANNAATVTAEFSDGLTAQFLTSAGQQYMMSFHKITSDSTATGVALW